MASSSLDFSSQAERLMEIASFFKISDKIRKQLKKNQEDEPGAKGQFIEFLTGMDDSDIRQLMTDIQTMARNKKDSDTNEKVVEEISGI